MSKILLKTENLYYRYPTRDEDALYDVNLTIEEGEFLAIIGQNGSGKTTLIKHFNGLLKPTSGRVVVDGQVTTELPTSELAKSVGYVFQNPDHQIFAESVYDEVAFGPKNLGISKENIDIAVGRVLKDMNLEDILEEMPFALSRGARQRLAVASVLAMEPAILIVDEPTTGQDWKESIALLELVRQLNEKGHTCIITTHNMNLVSLFARRVVVMRDARIFLDGLTQDVFCQVSKLLEAGIKPPEVYRLAKAVIPDETFDCLLTPDELASVLDERIEGLIVDKTDHTAGDKR
jgi:energy-coupling factor transporter ATP-binding protein EcfA2